MKYLIGLIIVALVIWGGYTLLQDAGTGGNTIKIGLSAPLTGEAASLGEGFAAGAKLAVKEINDAGGIDGRKIELIIEDDQCSSKGVNAITKLVEVDRVVAMVGPLCSAAAGPGLPIAQEAGVPVIVIGSAPHLTVIGDFIYRNYPSDSFQGKFAADYIFNNLEKKKAAVVYVKNDWGQGIADVFMERFKELGGEIVHDEGVPQDTTDLRTTFTKVKAETPDVLYTPLYPAGGIAALKQIKELGIETTVVGGDAFAGEEIWQVPEAEGILYTVAKISNPEEFQAKVKEETGISPGTYTPFSYDAVKILAKVIEKVGTDQELIKAELARITYRDAVAVPLVEFDDKGDLKEAEFEVMMIKNGKAEAVMKKDGDTMKKDDDVMEKKDDTE